MSSGGTQVSEENSKGWGSNNDFALAANWDAWENLAEQKDDLVGSDAYTLRRVDGPPKRT